MTKPKPKAPQPLPPPQVVDPDAVTEDQTITVGDIVKLPEDEANRPGFEMSDDPFDVGPDPEPPFYVDPDVENVPEAVDDPVAGDPAHLPRQDPAGDVEIMPPHLLNVSYESRIQVLEAWRYVGNFQNAPGWVDRNWLAHGDYDPLRQIEPGPALRVPLESGTVYARIGDYLCKQAITLAAGVPAEIRLEVWPAETFQKLFMPRRPKEVGVTMTHTSVTSSQPRKHGASSPQEGLDVA